MSFFGSSSGRTTNPLLEKIDKLRAELKNIPKGSPAWENKSKELSKAIYKERGEYLKGRSERPFDDGVYGS